MSRDEIQALITESLHSLEVGLQIFEAGERIAWFWITTELHRLLLDKGSGPLAKQISPPLTLSPLRNDLSKSSLKLLFALPGFSSSEGSVRFDLFDDEKQPIGLDDWVQQVVAVSAEQELSLGDFIILMRHKRTAHTELKPLGGKAQAANSFAMLSERGESFSATTRLLVDIGHHVLGQICRTLNLSTFSTTIPIISRRNLLDATEIHQSAKNRLDSIVSEKAVDGVSECESAISEMKQAITMLDLGNLAGHRLKMMAHLAEAFRFKALLSKDTRHILEAFAVLQYSTVIAESANEPANYHLALLNLALFCEESSKHLEQRMFLDHSLEILEKLIHLPGSNVSVATTQAAIEAAMRITRRLLRFRSYLRYRELLKSLNPLQHGQDL